MTNKARKQLIEDYLKEPTSRALEKGDSFWANVTPLGREFGSKDYERLLEHDHLGSYFHQFTRSSFSGSSRVSGRRTCHASGLGARVLAE